MPDLDAITLLAFVGLFALVLVIGAVYDDIKVDVA